jgi:putative dimethyl sulfoxide reductase chaperone
MSKSKLFTNADIPDVRSVLYKLFSLGFSYPQSDLFALLQNGKYLSAVLHGISSLAHLKDLVVDRAGLTRKVMGILGNTTREDLEVGFVQTFDVGAPEPPCPPYEGVYREGESRTSVMLRISEFYKHFGLNMSRKEDRRELPDHLCVELEFLHFLAFKEAQAKREDNKELVKGYLLAQKDFLERHIARWVPRFSDKVKTTGAPFYTELAGLLSGFVTLELAWLNTALSANSETGEGNTA